MSEITYYQDGPFWTVQVAAAKYLQGVQDSVALDTFWVLVTWFGYGVIYISFIFLWMLFMDFTGGMLMFFVLMESVFFNNWFKSFLKGTRPFWIDPTVRTLECQDISWGFPSGHVQNLVNVMLYIGLYMCFSTRARRMFSWPLWKRSTLFMFYVLQVLLFVILQCYSRVSLGVHFISDVTGAILLGIIGFVLHVFVLFPLVIKPLASYTVKTRYKGLITAIGVSTLIFLFNLCLAAASFIVPQVLYPVPTDLWALNMNIQCPYNVQINAPATILETLFKVVGIMYGIMLSWFLCLKYFPFINTAGTWPLKIARVVAYAIAVAPVGALAGAYYLFFTQQIYYTFDWTFYSLSIVFDTLLCPLFALYLTIGAPWLVHKFNKRLFPMSYVYWRSAFGIPVTKQDLIKELDLEEELNDDMGFELLDTQLQQQLRRLRRERLAAKPTAVVPSSKDPDAVVLDDAIEDGDVLVKTPKATSEPAVGVATAQGQDIVPMHTSTWKPRTKPTAIGYSPNSDMMSSPDDSDTFSTDNSAGFWHWNRRNRSRDGDTERPDDSLFSTNSVASDDAVSPIAPEDIPDLVGVHRQDEEPPASRTNNEAPVTLDTSVVQAVMSRLNETLVGDYEATADSIEPTQLQQHQQAVDTSQQLVRVDIVCEDAETGRIRVQLFAHSQQDNL